MNKQSSCSLDSIVSMTIRLHAGGLGFESQQGQETLQTIHTSFGAQPYSSGYGGVGSFL